VHIHQPFNCFSFRHPNHPFFFFAVLEQDQRRNRHHPIPLRKGGTIVDIELRDSCRARVLLGEPFDDWRKSAAWATTAPKNRREPAA
jgi:hypothetical protein